MSHFIGMSRWSCGNLKGKEEDGGVRDEGDKEGGNRGGRVGTFGKWGIEEGKKDEVLHDINLSITYAWSKTPEPGTGFFRMP